MLGGQPPIDGRELALRIGVRHGRFQPRDDREVVEAAFGSFGWTENPWNEDVVVGNDAEGRRHHADNGKRRPVERDRSTEDVWIARESPSPETVAQHGGAAALPEKLSRDWTLEIASNKRSAEPRHDTPRR